MKIEKQKRWCRDWVMLQLTVILFVSWLVMAKSVKHSDTDEPAVSDRSLIIVVDDDAPPQIKAAADQIKSAVQQLPLLKLLTGEHEPVVIDSQALLSGKVDQRSFNNLIVLGLPKSKVVAEVWQHEATAESDGISIFGFGHFKGDLGYIESQRNPYLHSEVIAKTPFETQLITITGSTPQGVALAANAFVHRGIVNGVIAQENNWSRTSTTLLDRPPIAPDVKLPPVPDELGKSPLIGVTQASGDEYRNVLSDTGFEPSTIWRFKYSLRGAWDAQGASSAIAEYKAGLHRRAFADTLWVGTFASADTAKIAAGKIAEAAGLSKTNNDNWTANATPGNGTPVELWITGSSVYLSDLKR